MPPIQNPNAQTRGPAPRFAPPPEVQNRPRRPAPLLMAAIVLAPVAWSLCQIQARGEDAGVAHGKELYAQNKCSICHSLGGKGGNVGPALDDAGKKWTAEKLTTFLSDPSSVHSDSAMPAM